MIRSRAARIGLELSVPVAVVAAWWVSSSNSSSVYFPSLQSILERFRVNWLGERVASDLLPSLSRLGRGYVVAVVAGTLVGLVLGMVPVLRKLFTPWISFLRSVPGAALLPFSILVFGIDDSQKIFIIAFACVWPIVLNTIDGLDEIDPVVLNTSRVYGVGRARHIASVMLPAASPRMFAGMRLSLSIAVFVLIVSEMAGSSDGVGFFTLQAQRTFAIGDMWSGILCLGLLGYVLNVVFVAFERRVLGWYFEGRAGGTA